MEDILIFKTNYFSIKTLRSKICFQETRFLPVVFVSRIQKGIYIEVFLEHALNDAIQRTVQVVSERYGINPPKSQKFHITVASFMKVLSEVQLRVIDQALSEFNRRPEMTLMAGQLVLMECCETPFRNIVKRKMIASLK